jgi:F-type H+-transporting ATPase subunit b
VNAAAALAIAGLLLVLGPDVARAAAEEGEHGTSLLWHVVNLILIVGVVVYFGRAPIKSFLAERRQKIAEGIAEAQRELASAEKRLGECQARAARLDDELAEIRRMVRDQAVADRERILADARATAERIRRDAVVAAEQEVRHARESLRAETADLAVRLAGEILHTQVTEDDRARLVDDFVERVAEAPAAGADARTPAGGS